jgi:5-methylcytosine-specific restriction endonuclease McrA
MLSLYIPMRKTISNYVKSGLRRMWGRSKQRSSALRAAKISYGKYECADCGEIFKRKEIEVDHKIPVGRFEGFDKYIERLFCDSRYLQILCKSCHKKKTAKDRRSFKKK